MNMKTLLAGAAALAIVAGSASSASALTTIYFDPFSSDTGTASGKDNVDTGSNPWSWTGKTWTYSGTYQSDKQANDFEISFVGGVKSIKSAVFKINGVAVEENTFGPGVAFGEVTPFYLNKGDTFSATIVVNGGTTNPGITATYTAVPELSTWGMMIAGFGALAMAGYRRRPVAA